MPTFTDIYNRILTDLNLNKHSFTVEYKNFDKTLEMPITKWKPITSGGDIPEHKVISIKFKGKVIWNKEKLCLINECQEVFDPSQVVPETFSVMTFNILSDEYEKTVTNLSKRFPQIFKFLKDSDCDIICLQEVQPSVLTELKKLEGIYTSHTLMGINDIVILTKIEPFSSELIDLGQQKCALMVTLKIENDKELNIVGVHLTSDYHNDNAIKRTTQLYKIKNYLEGKKHIILLGDTNEPVYEHTLGHFMDYLDCWINLKNVREEKGYTYDPTVNLLAKKLSNNRNPLRLDRILYSNNSALNCTEVNVNNTSQTVQLSDHYPLIAKFSLNVQLLYQDLTQQQTTALTNQTALCIIPPHELWRKLDSLRVKNTNLQELRWMHHLNLFFGFVQPDNFYSIYKEIKKLNLQPFSVTFDKISYFAHEKTFTLFLQPNDESNFKLTNLYQNLKTIFNDNKMTWMPHITLGNFAEESKIQNYIRQQVNISFKVNILSFVSRIGYEYFKVVRNIVFDDIPMNFYIEFVKSVCKSQGVESRVCGSRIFELNKHNSSACDESDADILCIGIVPRAVFFSKLTKIAETCGYFKKVCIAKNKHVFCLKLKTSNNNLDIQYVNTTDMDDMYCKTGMAMYNEPKYMVDMLTKINKLDLFKQCLTWIKNKLKGKNMYGGLFGFTSGMSLSILVTYLVKHSTVNCLETFIEKLKVVDFTKPIFLGQQNTYDVSKPCDRLMYIGTSTTPIENTMRHVYKSSAFLMKTQFASGFETDDSSLFTKELTFTINAVDDESLNDCIEWFNGLVTKMMVAIERNCKDTTVVFPSTKWQIVESDDRIEGTWKLKASNYASTLDYIAEKMIKESKQLFTKAFLSYV